MKTNTIALALLVLYAAATLTAKDKDYGSLVFSYMQTRRALSNGESSKTGIEIYMKASMDQNNPGSDVTIIEYRYDIDPKVDAIYSRNDDFRLTLKEIDFSPFDWESEIREAEEIRQKNEESMILNLDGSEYEIRYEFDGHSFLVRDWNIGGALDIYAPYSEKVSKLKAVVEESARLFGRMRLNLE